MDSEILNSIPTEGLSEELQRTLRIYTRTNVHNFLTNFRDIINSPENWVSLLEKESEYTQLINGSTKKAVSTLDGMSRTHEVLRLVYWEWEGNKPEFCEYVKEKLLKKGIAIKSNKSRIVLYNIARFDEYFSKFQELLLTHNRFDWLTNKDRFIEKISIGIKDDEPADVEGCIFQAVVNRLFDNPQFPPDKFRLSKCENENDLQSIMRLYGGSIEYEHRYRTYDKAHLVNVLGQPSTMKTNRLKNTTYESTDPAKTPPLYIRLRQEGNPSSALLTVKIPKVDGSFADELETFVTDADATHNILREMGYQVKYVVDKIRETWAYPHFELVFDQYPAAPEFLEIETNSRRRLLDLERKLGLTPDSFGVADLYRELYGRTEVANNVPLTFDTVAQIVHPIKNKGLFRQLLRQQRRVLGTSTHHAEKRRKGHH
jgi:adenylate cyclase class IV